MLFLVWINGRNNSCIAVFLHMLQNTTGETHSGVGAEGPGSVGVAQDQGGVGEVLDHGGVPEMFIGDGERGAVDGDGDFSGELQF